MRFLRIGSMCRPKACTDKREKDMRRVLKQVGENEEGNKKDRRNACLFLRCYKLFCGRGSVSGWGCSRSDCLGFLGFLRFFGFLWMCLGGFCRGSRRSGCVGSRCLCESNGSKQTGNQGSD
jgi:hypothetical protein